MAPLSDAKSQIIKGEQSCLPPMSREEMSDTEGEVPISVEGTVWHASLHRITAENDDFQEPPTSSSSDCSQKGK